MCRCMNLVLAFFQLIYNFIKTIAIITGLLLFHSTSKKYAEIYGEKIYFESVHQHEGNLSINNINGFGVKVGKFTIGIIDNAIGIAIDKLNILKFNFNLRVFYKDILQICGDALNNKINFKCVIKDGRVNLTTSGIEENQFTGCYSGANLIIGLQNGIFAYASNRIRIKSDNKRHFLHANIDLDKREIENMNFYLKNGRVKLSLDEEWNFQSKDENISMEMKLDKMLKGSGHIEINKKFGLLDSNLNFDIEVRGMSVYACGKKKQIIKIPDFNLHETNVKWDLHFNIHRQDFELKSDAIDLYAKFFTNYIKFNLRLDSDKLDLSAFGFIDYNNNIVIEGAGDYISLLDMTGLFRKRNKNTLRCKFKWRRAKWIENLYLEDMKISCYKGVQGVESCNIEANFEHNPVLLWKNELHDPLFFKVWNFGRAFELMYGENLFQSTGILDGYIYVEERGMPWNFTLHDFRAMQRLNAIYLQILSLKFWASLFKGNQKDWHYLSGNGYISKDKYEINELKMDNDYFRIDASGFISRKSDFLDLNGALGTKSIASDLRDLIDQEGKNKIAFHMHGSLKSPTIDNKIGFRKLAAPILPFAFFLI